jgi:radical SAM superfamily enzyme YgiQ (UPF0313 family)
LRIFLVSVNRETAPYPVAPIGLAYVACAVRDAGHEVELLDLCFSTDIRGDISRATARFSPELIGISIRNVDNLSYPASVSYLDEIRQAVATLKASSDAPIVAGGPGFSIFPEALLSLLDLEMGIVGEGEETFRALARHLSMSEAVPDLPGLLRRGMPARTLARRAAPFSGNGVPARDLLDNARYLGRGGMANLQTKRGCPFECAYCTYPHINGPQLRLRPAGEVAEELADMAGRYGIDHVFFVDDLFNWPTEHALEICEAICTRGVAVEWTCFATPRGMTPALARAMKRAGCRGVEFGSDTASPAMLEALRKPFGLPEILAASEACRQAGLPDAHYLIFGGPGESEKTLAETFAAFDRITPRAVLALLGVRVYPNTPLHAIAVEEGAVEGGDDLLLPRFYFSPHLGPEALTSAVASHAGLRPNWVVPSLGIRSDPALLDALRRMGHKGPLWDMLGAPASTIKKP